MPGRVTEQEIKFLWLEGDPIKNTKRLRANIALLAETEISGQHLNKDSAGITLAATELLSRQVLDQAYGDIRQKVLAIQQMLQRDAICAKSDLMSLLAEILSITEGSKGEKPEKLHQWEE